MQNITYRLIPGGYEILNNGTVWIHQPFDPNKPGMVPFGNDQEAEAAAQAYIAALTGGSTQPLQLKLTSLTCAAPGAIVDQAVPEATLPKNTMVTARGEVQMNGAVVTTFTGKFRLPIVASDGRERIILATITNGIMEASWTPSESGKWRITEAAINSALPPDRKMGWKELTVYVLD